MAPPTAPSLETLHHAINEVVEQANALTYAVIAWGDIPDESQDRDQLISTYLFRVHLVRNSLTNLLDSIDDDNSRNLGIVQG